MFAVILRARPDPGALTASLGPLIRGVVAGLVGSAYLVCEHADGALAEIAEASGARLLVAQSWTEGFAQAVALSKGGGIIVLDTGVMLGPDFWPILADFAPILGDKPAITKSARATGLIDAVAYRINALRGIPNPDQVLVMPGAMARSLARGKADPLRHGYGKSLLRLPCQTVRVKG